MASAKEAKDDFARGSGIHHDFARDVEERLRKAGVNMYGCPLDRVEPRLDGTVAVFFAGVRKDNGVQWSGGIRANATLLHQKKAFADPEAVSQVIQAIIEKHDLAWKDEGKPDFGAPKPGIILP